MDAEAILERVALPGRALRTIAPGLWSALPEDIDQGEYDRFAAAYDAVVGNRFYSRLMWSIEPRRYADFAAEALRSAEGPLLDVGGGSLVFTARAYADAERPIVVLDRSLGMLERARQRILTLAGRWPAHLVLLHGDGLDPPLAPARVATVHCPGILHLFSDSDAGALLRAIQQPLAPGGSLFVSTLVARGRIGARYLRLLARRGGVAAARSPEQVRAILEAESGRIELRTEGALAFARCERRVFDGPGADVAPMQRP